jgi:small glutamine-rich tetratricopeptide repeat-containing protein alpha
MSDALAGQSLLAIYNVFEKMKGKSTPKPATPPTGPKQPSEGELAEAEALKNKGNAAMSQNDYHTAIDFYTQALKLIPTNPIYLSNRAAAYINVKEYDAAIRDAEIAVDTDPSYGKGWSRLGLARSGKGDNRGAMEAYKAGIDADGNGGSKALRDGYKTAKEKVDAEEENVSQEGGLFDPNMVESLMKNNPMIQSLLGGEEGTAQEKLAKLATNPFVQELCVLFASLHYAALMFSRLAKFMSGGGIPGMPGMSGMPGMPGAGSGSGPR